MRFSTVRYIGSALILACGIAITSCASVLSPVAPPVTADACQKLTTCGECISNTACGFCGNACVAATSADARDAAPKTCTGQWVWKLGTCPDTAPSPAASTSKL